jgi:hypothetical protein
MSNSKQSAKTPEYNSYVSYEVAEKFTPKFTHNEICTTWIETYGKYPKTLNIIVYFLTYVNKKQNNSLFYGGTPLIFFNQSTCSPHLRGV